MGVGGAGAPVVGFLIFGLATIFYPTPMYYR